MLITVYSGILGTLNLYLLWLIFKAKKSNDSRNQAILAYLMPLNFTFMFVYYTETASLTSLLILYYRMVCIQNSNSLLNIIFAFVSLLMRQTNVIWINYFAIIALIQQEKQAISKHIVYLILILDILSFVLKQLTSLHKLIWSHFWLVLVDLSFVAFVILNNGSIVLGH